MDQLVDSSTPALPQSFEERVSLMRLWTLLPVLFVPLFAWQYLSQRLGASSDVYQAVFNLLICGLLFAWWLFKSAPRPYSVQAAMGRPPNLAAWGLVAMVLFGINSLLFIWRLAPDLPQIVEAARNGRAFYYTAAQTAPSFLKVLTAIVLGPITEELVFRGTIFRKWRVRLGPSMAVLLTSVVFAAFHKDILGAFLGGATYALVYTRTRSLWASVAVHVLFNGILYGLDVLSYLSDGPKRLRLHSPWEYAAFALVLLVGVGAWVHFVVTSWRTLGDPLPPDSLQTAPVASASSLPEALRIGG